MLPHLPYSRFIGLWLYYLVYYDSMQVLPFTHINNSCYVVPAFGGICIWNPLMITSFALLLIASFIAGTLFLTGRLAIHWKRGA